MRVINIGCLLIENKIESLRFFRSFKGTKILRLGSFQIDILDLYYDDCVYSEQTVFLLRVLLEEQMILQVSRNNKGIILK